MRRLCCLMIGIGILMTMVYAISVQGVFDLIMFAMPYIVATIGLPLCIKKEYMFPITSLLLTVTIYNFIYFILKYIVDIDIFEVKWRIPVQYAIPLMIGYILQYRYENRESGNQ